jgi:hypothetical protein
MRILATAGQKGDQPVACHGAHSVAGSDGSRREHGRPIDRLARPGRGQLRGPMGATVYVRPWSAPRAALKPTGPTVIIGAAVFRLGGGNTCEPVMSSAGR